MVVVVSAVRALRVPVEEKKPLSAFVYVWSEEVRRSLAEDEEDEDRWPSKNWTSNFPIRGGKV